MRRGNVLVAGFSTRHVAKSAYSAGFAVYAIDHFCDLDLDWYTQDRLKFEDLDELPDRIQEMCERYRFDYFIPTSGAERLGEGMHGDTTCIQRFLDKLTTAKFFEEIGISSPRILSNPAFPCVVKPRSGAGGWRNRLLSGPDELRAWFEKNPDTEAILQEYVEGLPASVSCISNGKSACAIAANEQILRGTEDAPFGFSGSVTPLDHPLREHAIQIATQCIAATGCTGSIGIDLVMGKGVWAIEINPRFQATLDTVEMSTGCNLFQMHIDALKGKVPDTPIAPRCYAARAILFADRPLEIRSDLSQLCPWVADIPRTGTKFEEGNAVVSVFGVGETRGEALDMLNRNITRVRRYVDR